MTETSPASLEEAALRGSVELVRERIAAACASVGRDPSEVAILPVSKSVPAGRLAAALAMGLTTFAENRVQEAEAKAAELPGSHWQLVGRLQSNKAARAVQLFEQIHSVDSVELARRIGRLATDADRAPYPIYCQVNVDGDPAKSGFALGTIEHEIDALAALDGLAVLGLMTVGRDVATAEQARPTFRALRELSVRLRARQPRLGPGLSMGMSHDFELAVEEGATVVRLGRVLFGERPTA